RLLNHEKSVSQLSELYGVSESAINSWKMKYEKNGVDGLKESLNWKKYSQELKEQAVLDYLDGKNSLRTICQKYDI
ncbi:helix-turn-helix domain-containing protein, partial [Streptococcus gallolyticus]